MKPHVLVAAALLAVPLTGCTTPTQNLTIHPQTRVDDIGWASRDTVAVALTIKNPATDKTLHLGKNDLVLLNSHGLQHAPLSIDPNCPQGELPIMESIQPQASIQGHVCFQDPGEPPWRIMVSGTNTTLATIQATEIPLQPPYPINQTIRDATYHNRTHNDFLELDVTIHNNLSTLSFDAPQTSFRVKTQDGETYDAHQYQSIWDGETLDPGEKIEGALVFDIDDDDMPPVDLEFDRKLVTATDTVDNWTET